MKRQLLFPLTVAAIIIIASLSRSTIATDVEYTCQDAGDLVCGSTMPCPRSCNPGDPCYFDSDCPFSGNNCSKCAICDTGVCGDPKPIDCSKLNAATQGPAALAVSPMDCYCPTGYTSCDHMGPPCREIKPQICWPQGIPDCLERYNVIAHTDFEGSKSDTEGGVCVGGNAKLSDYSVGAAIESDFFNNDATGWFCQPLIVGGICQGKNLRIYGGNCHVGQVYSQDKGEYSDAVEEADISFDSRELGTVFRQLDFDIDQIFDKFITLSENLAALLTTGTITVDADIAGVFLNGSTDCAGAMGGYNAFDLDAKYLNGWDRYLKVPDESLVVITVLDGGHINFGDRLDTIPQGDHFKIIWNFPNATSLRIYNIALNGVVLAPRADIYAGSGYLAGLLICHSFHPDGVTGQTLQINNPNTDIKDFFPPCGSGNVPPVQHYVCNQGNGCPTGEYCGYDNTCSKCVCNQPGSCQTVGKCNATQSNDQGWYCIYPAQSNGQTCGIAPPSSNPCSYGSYLAISDALNDAQVNGAESDHFLWLPSLFPDSTACAAAGIASSISAANDWRIVTDGSYPVAQFVMAQDHSTVEMTATLYNGANAAFKLQCDVVLSGFSSTFNGSPKEQLTDSCYHSNQKCEGVFVDPTTWYYWKTVKGTCTGLEAIRGAGLSFNLELPYYAQLGIGANGKNLNYGISFWLQWSITADQTTQGCLMKSLAASKNDITNQQAAARKDPKQPVWPVDQTGDVNCDIGTSPQCFNADGVCVDGTCKAVVNGCHQWDFKSTMTVKLLNSPTGEALAFSFNPYGLRTDGMYLQNHATSGTYDEVLWNFEYNHGEMISDMRMSYNNVTNELHIYGVAYGGKIKQTISHTSYSYSWAPGFPHKAIIDFVYTDVTASNGQLSAPASSGVGCITDVTYPGNLTFNLVGYMGDFLIESPFRNYWGWTGHGWVNYWCGQNPSSSTHIASSDWLFALGECIEPSSDAVNPVQCNCDSTQNCKLLITSGECPNVGTDHSVIISGKIGSGFAPLGSSHAHPEHAIKTASVSAGQQFIQDILHTIDLLAGDGRRVDLLDESIADDGSYLINITVNPAITDDSATADLQSAINVALAIGDHLNDDTSSLRQGVTGSYLDASALSATDGGNPGSYCATTGTFANTCPAAAGSSGDSFFTTGTIAAISGCAAGAVLLGIVGFCVVKRRRAQAPSARPNVPRSASQVEMLGQKDTMTNTDSENEGQGVPSTTAF